MMCSCLGAGAVESVAVLEPLSNETPVWLHVIDVILKDSVPRRMRRFSMESAGDNMPRSSAAGLSVTGADALPESGNWISRFKGSLVTIIK